MKFIRERGVNSIVPINFSTLGNGNPYNNATPLLRAHDRTQNVLQRTHTLLQRKVF